MTEFKKGDRVRVTHEGEITWVDRAGEGFEVTAERSAGTGKYVYAHREQLTLLERAKPTLKAGDVVTTPGGGVYLIGYRKIAFTIPGGEIIDAREKPEELASRIAERPGQYKINGEVFA